MKRSLQQHLSLILGSAILLAGLLAAIASFTLAYSEAKELQDDMLRQIAKLSTKNSDSVDIAQLSLNKEDATDPESRVSVFHLPRDITPIWLKRDLSPGLHTLDADLGELRVFVGEAKLGAFTVVSQPTEVRNEIALNSALRTLIPLLLLQPILMWLIARIVRNQLAPITQLSSRLDEQPAYRPQPVADTEVPQEIASFVHAINRLLSRINHLQSQQQRFIADAAHELRSPLTALSLQAQNLKQAESIEAVRERVIPLQEGIERARNLTEQLLNMARTQASIGADAKINVSTMARELIAEYLPVAEKKHIDLGLEEIAPVFLQGSLESLRMILKNALENSLKYSPDGGEITLRLNTDKLEAVVEVIDNGPGISASERERVFDSFYRVPGTAGEGSGLGLAIAMEAANRLGGVISLHDAPDGHGLVFRYRQIK